MDMDQHLLVFITVAEKQNFSRAAEELHMTQPAVSQYIKALEQTMGTKLLERTNKYVRLSKAGEIVYQQSKEILGLYTKMKSLVDDLTNHARGPLSIGASYTFGEYVLPHVIAKMQAQYPEISPTITIGNTAEIAVLVTNHQLDVGIVEGHFTNQQLSIEPIALDSMLVVGAKNHPLAQKSGFANVSDLEKETWIVRENGSGTREASEKLFRLYEFFPEKIMEFGSTQLIKESVEAGLGISLLSHWAIQKDLLLECLKVIDVKGLPLSREFSIVMKTSIQTKALEVFLELLRNDKMLTTFNGEL